MVDIVDNSPEMLEIGKAADPKEHRLRWIVGDISMPLSQQSVELEAQYDITMVNWTFDHAKTIEVLEEMCSNVSRYTKHGGKLISIRMANPRATSAKDGKYGVSFSNVELTAGGLKYVYTAHIDPALSCPATTVTECMGFEEVKLMARRFGFADFKMVSESEGEVVKQEPEFWKLHIEDPVWICVEATKVGY